MFEYNKHSMALNILKQNEIEKKAFAPELVGGIARFAVPMLGQLGLYKAIEHSFKPNNIFNKVPVVGRMLRGMAGKADKVYKPGDHVNPVATNTMIADTVGPLAASAIAEPFISKFENSFQPKPQARPHPRPAFQQSNFELPSFQSQPSYQPSFQQPQHQSFSNLAPSNIISQYGR